MIGAAGLIKVVIVIGLFTGDHFVNRYTAYTTLAECIEISEFAQEYNQQFRWFWEDEPRNFKVACLEHPDDLEI